MPTTFATTRSIRTMSYVQKFVSQRWIGNWNTLVPESLVATTFLTTNLIGSGTDCGWGFRLPRALMMLPSWVEMADWRFSSVNDVIGVGWPKYSNWIAPSWSS